MHTIKNTTRQVVLLRFTDGEERNLGPGQTLEITPRELAANASLRKLEQRQLVNISPLKPAPVATPAKEPVPTAAAAVVPPPQSDAAGSAPDSPELDDSDDPAGADATRHAQPSAPTLTGTIRHEDPKPNTKKQK